MAATYDELLTEIQRWLDNDNPNLVAAIPDFIATAEDYLDQEVVHWRRETDQNFVYAGNGEYTLPADFNGVASLVDDGTQVVLTYRQKLERLGPGTQTNWLLAESGTLYRYASLAQAEGWLKNDPRIQVWSSLSERALKAINEQGMGQPIGQQPPEDRAFRKRPLAGSTSQWLEYVTPAEAKDIIYSGATKADNNGRQVYSIWGGILHVVPTT